MSDMDEGDEENANLGQPWPEWQVGEETYRTILADLKRERDAVKAALGLTAGGTGLTLVQEVERLVERTNGAYVRGWNEALNAAEFSVISAPTALKTTNNVPTYYMARETVIEAIRSLASSSK